MINYILIFALNLSIESSVCFLFGFRKRIEYMGVFAVNGITHPLLMFVLNILYALDKRWIGYIIILELLIVMAEWKLFEFMFKKKTYRYLLISGVMNLTSYLVGVIMSLI